MTGATTFGRIWRRMSRASEQPIVRAAITYSMLPGGEHRTADQAGVARDRSQADRDHHIDDALAQGKEDGQRQQKTWKGQQHIGAAHHDRLDPATEVASDQPQGESDRAGDARQRPSRAKERCAHHESPG